jgi:hypothetical protein
MELSELREWSISGRPGRVRARAYRARGQDGGVKPLPIAPSSGFHASYGSTGPWRRVGRWVLSAPPPTGRGWPAAAPSRRPSRLCLPSPTLGSGCWRGGLALVDGQLPSVCRKRCLAMPHIALGHLSRRQPLTCDVVLPRWVPHRCPRSLHTAAATGLDLFSEPCAVILGRLAEATASPWLVASSGRPPRAPRPRVCPGRPHRAGER